MAYETLFHNCLSVCEENGMYLPLRFTQAQLAYFKGLKEMLYIRSLATAGITLDVFCSSDTISFNFACGPFSRDQDTFTLFEDGRKALVHPVCRNNPLGRLVYHKRRTASRITVWLPAMTCTRIGSFDLGVWTPVPAFERRLLCLGDSITQGIWCENSSNTYPARLARKLQVELLNQGVGGFYFNADSLIDCIWPAQAITVAYGTNHLPMSTNASDAEQAADAYLTRLLQLYPQASITVISPIWRDRPNEDTALFREICQSVQRQATIRGLPCVDGFALMDHDPTLLADGLHPNDQGFAQYAGRLLPFLADHFG